MILTATTCYPTLTLLPKHNIELEAITACEKLSTKKRNLWITAHSHLKDFPQNRIICYSYLR